MKPPFDEASQDALDPIPPTHSGTATPEEPTVPDDVPALPSVATLPTVEPTAAQEALAEAAPPDLKN